MKTCPVCNSTCFDDMPICYGCLHDFSRAPAGARRLEIAEDDSIDEALEPAESIMWQSLDSFEEAPEERAEGMPEEEGPQTMTHILVPLVSSSSTESRLVRMPYASADEEDAAQPAHIMLEAPRGCRVVLSFE